ncbi:MAG: GAF domain-containing sensor histidine kinase, partial [Leptolyngbya sp. SIO1D8]|nr:GAF domain-containing sensor histidine kinase [Leptolyngbya sp. SIO1D8]
MSQPYLMSTIANQHSLALATAQMRQSSVDLLDIEFPVFEEATQTASRFLDVPICIVGIPNENTLVLKAATGLSQLGLMNPLARKRRLTLDDKLVSYVLQKRQQLILPNIRDCEPFAQSFLVQEYGIQAYLGVPLLTTEGNCIGLLAAMDVAPCQFSTEAVAFMELLARWSVSEYERHHLSQQLAEPTMKIPVLEAHTSAEKPLLDTVRLTLMSQLTEEMRTPLTTITGMANVLSREIYGALTPKQREYAEIVHNSSQMLLEMANEILELGNLGTHFQPLNRTSVDLEMLKQHVQKTLIPIAKENHQEIHLTVEPGSRFWKLDKEVVRQLLYHLAFSIIQLSGEGGTVRIHASGREDALNMTVWFSHPWLGEGLPKSVLTMGRFLSDPTATETDMLSMPFTQSSQQAG